jgi:tRNA A37 threonylcarbamoyladenosine biosynthesis protein TsaE
MGGICFIEWAERVMDLVPDDAKKVHFQSINDTDREIQYI